MFDPDHCSFESLDDNDQYGNESYVYDTYDQIIDTNRGDENMFDDGLSPADLGLAFAFAEEIRGAEHQDWEDLSEEIDREFSREFDVEVDEDTDRENWDKVMKMTSLHSRHKERSRLRPFEQYVDDIFKGRRSLFED